MSTRVADRAHERPDVTRGARAALVGSAVLTAALYAVPFGGLAIYPLLLLSTLAHELGHGLTAVALGGQFREFYLWPDGSGMAVHAGPSGHVLEAMVSAGGLVGPALVAALFFALARRERVARAALGLVGVGGLAAVLLVVNNPFGRWYVGLASLTLVALAGVSPSIARSALVFLAVQLALSVFSRGDYLFTDTAVTSGGTMPSDVAQIAAALGGPYWLWGAVCGLFSVLVLVFGLWLFLRGGTARRGLSALRSR